jgi:hypothetical protein
VGQGDASGGDLHIGRHSWTGGRRRRQDDGAERRPRSLARSESEDQRDGDGARGRCVGHADCPLSGRDSSRKPLQ